MVVLLGHRAQSQGKEETDLETKSKGATAALSEQPQDRRKQGRGCDPKSQRHVREQSRDSCKSADNGIQSASILKWLYFQPLHKGSDAMRMMVLESAHSLSFWLCALRHGDKEDQGIHPKK